MRTVLRARIGRRTARIRNAIVWDNAGEYFRPLDDKNRKPHGEEEPPHEPTIPRVPFRELRAERERLGLRAAAGPSAQGQ